MLNSQDILLRNILGNNFKMSFNYDNYDLLTAPPLRSLFSDQDIQNLIKIATSIRFNSNITKKRASINEIMNSRGFKLAYAGTNRLIFNYLEDPRFIAKVAIDRVGMTDSPAEFRNQRFFKPFCCKIFEVDPSGVIALVEKVHPITSIDEFIEISNDIYLLTKFILTNGKYIADDIGSASYMNYGIRPAFGPVILDYPYIYGLDPNKLICHQMIENKITRTKEICNGLIDYDEGFDKLYCNKCHHVYTAQEIGTDPNLSFLNNYNNRLFESIFIKNAPTKVTLKNSKDEIIIESEPKTSPIYLSSEEYDDEYNIPPDDDIQLIDHIFKNYLKLFKFTDDISPLHYDPVQVNFIKILQSKCHLFKNIYTVDDMISLHSNLSSLPND